MSDQNNAVPKSSLHEKIETSNFLLIALTLFVLTIGGLVEIVPLFFQKSTTEAVAGLKPYTPLQLMGRDVYLREGCYNCHSQMIRPFRAETMRYGHYSVAGEFVYDHPFQWGSKRTGPDLARVGGKYSDQWQLDHLNDPRSVVPASIMPGYPFLARTRLDAKHIADDMKVLRIEGVPYTDDMIANAQADLRTQTTTDADGTDDLQARYPKAQVRDFDGNPAELTEADALIAYLQMLGTLVDFKLYDNKANVR
jgi:cytochrome c oxidase cbb3-type subunit 2